MIVNWKVHSISVLFDKHQQLSYWHCKDMQRSSSYSPPAISDHSSSSASSSTSPSITPAVTGGYTPAATGGYTPATNTTTGDYCMSLSNQGYPFISNYNNMDMSTYCATAAANSSCLLSSQNRTAAFQSSLNGASIGRYTYYPSNGLSYAVESPTYIASSYTQQETSPTSTLPPSPQSSPQHTYSPSDETNSLHYAGDTTSTSSPPPPPTAIGTTVIQSTDSTVGGPYHRTVYNGSMSYSSLPLWTPSGGSSSETQGIDSTSTNSYHLMNAQCNGTNDTSSYYSSGTAGHYNYPTTSYPNTSNVYYTSSYPLTGGSTATDYSTAYQSSTAAAFALWNYPSFQVSPVSKVSYDSPRYKLTPERAIPLIKWFEDHKEHPYPSRHEKMLLCQSTLLTFTQVSTWFANARRRLKKASQDDEDLEDDDENIMKNELNTEGHTTQPKLLIQ